MGDRAMRMASRLVVGAVAMGSVAMGAIPAGASDPEVFRTRSSVSYVDKATDSKDRFAGKVSSGAEDCLADRTVKVFKKKRDGSTVKVGSDHTGATGNWKVPSKDANGKFFVTVDKAVGLDEYGNPVLVCRAHSSQSNLLRV